MVELVAVGAAILGLPGVGVVDRLLIQATSWRVAARSYNHHCPQRRARVHKMAEPAARQPAQLAAQEDSPFRKVFGMVQV